MRCMLMICMLFYAPYGEEDKSKKKETVRPNKVDEKKKCAIAEKKKLPLIFYTTKQNKYSIVMYSCGWKRSATLYECWPIVDDKTCLVTVIHVKKYSWGERERETRHWLYIDFFLMFLRLCLPLNEQWMNEWPNLPQWFWKKIVQRVNKKEERKKDERE